MSDLKHHLEVQSSIEDLENLSRFSKKVAGDPTLEKYFLHIKKIYIDKRSKRGLSPYSCARGYLMRSSYALTRHLEVKKCLPRIANVTYEQENPRPPTLEQNPFHWTLVGITGAIIGEVKGDEGLMYRSSRSDMSRQLLYAHRQNVPTEYLVGFIYQTGKRWEATNLGY